MERNVDIAEISDGRTYGENDMVKADCGGCQGCSDCCRDMVDTIILDPLDMYRLTTGLHKNFNELLENQITLNVYQGLILPHLLMSEETGGCPFLDKNGWCTVHAIRPGFCRIFPLGRYYQNGDFTYIIQIHECPRPKSKIKVKKWIDTPDLKRNRVFINQWHDLQKEMQTLLAQSNDAVQKALTLQFLKLFYQTPYTEDDFYPQFDERYATMLSLLR